MAVPLLKKEKIMRIYDIIWTLDTDDDFDPSKNAPCHADLPDDFRNRSKRAESKYNIVAEAGRYLSSLLLF